MFCPFLYFIFFSAFFFWFSFSLFCPSMPLCQTKTKNTFVESLTKSQGVRSKFGYFHRKTHCNRNRIVTEKNRLLESGQACGHHLQLFQCRWPHNATLKKIAAYCDPGCLLQGPQTSQVPKVVRRGCKKVFWTQSAKVFLHWCKRELHRCKTGFRCKRLLGDLCSLGPKHLLHPLLTTLSTFEVSQKTREGCGCPKFVAGKVFRQISTLLENYSQIFRQREMLSLPRFGHFPARKMAAGKSAPPSGTLLDFLLQDRHSLLEFSLVSGPCSRHPGPQAAYSFGRVNESRTSTADHRRETAHLDLKAVNKVAMASASYRIENPELHKIGTQIGKK